MHCAFSNFQSARRERLTCRERWIIGGFAVDARGSVVPPEGPDACKWCLMGALGINDLDPGFWSPEQEAAYALLIDAIAEANPDFETSSVDEFNDNVEFAEVATALDRAIALAETEKAEVQE